MAGRPANFNEFDSWQRSTISGSTSSFRDILNPNSNLPEMDRLDDARDKLYSQETSVQLEAATVFRKALSKGECMGCVQKEQREGK